MKTIKYIMIIAGLCLVHSLQAQESVYDIISHNGCPAMKVAGEPRLYAGDDLFSLINGGADLYHEYGFSEVLALEAGMEEGMLVKTEIYDMGSPGGAWGIFSVTATANARSVDIGQEGRQGEGFLQFIKGRFMLYLYHAPEAAEDALQIAGCIADGIRETAGRPVLMDVLDNIEGDDSKIVFFMGNLGLSTVYSFHYRDVFGYGTGAAAVYPGTTVIVLDYPDEENCLENFHAAQNFFMNSSRYSNSYSHRGSFHMDDNKGQHIASYFENSYLFITIGPGEKDNNNIRLAVMEGMNRLRE
jgi:hypothetical protein